MVGRAPPMLACHWARRYCRNCLPRGEFIEKLIPLIPRPRVYTVRYHGVLARASGWRAEVVPAHPDPGRAAEVLRN